MVEDVDVVEDGGLDRVIGDVGVIGDGGVIRDRRIIGEGGIKKTGRVMGDVRMIEDCNMVWCVKMKNKG